VTAADIHRAIDGSLARVAHCADTSAYWTLIDRRNRPCLPRSGSDGGPAHRPRQDPQAGLNLVDRLRAEPLLKDDHLLPGVRGDLLRRLARFEEAAQEFERASSLTRNTASGSCSSSERLGAGDRRLTRSLAS